MVNYVRDLLISSIFLSAGLILRCDTLSVVKIALFRISKLNLLSTCLVNVHITKVDC